MKKLNVMSESSKIESLLSQILKEDVLSVEEMICIRGGEGDEPPIRPPDE